MKAYDIVLGVILLISSLVICFEVVTKKPIQRQGIPTVKLRNEGFIYSAGKKKSLAKNDIVKKNRITLIMAIIMIASTVLMNILTTHLG